MGKVDTWERWGRYVRVQVKFQKEILWKRLSRNGKYAILFEIFIENLHSPTTFASILNTFFKLPSNVTSFEWNSILFSKYYLFNSTLKFIYIYIFILRIIKFSLYPLIKKSFKNWRQLKKKLKKALDKNLKEKKKKQIYSSKQKRSEEKEAAKPLRFIVLPVGKRRQFLNVFISIRIIPFPEICLCQWNTTPFASTIPGAKIFRAQQKG